jgi:hypothetical protein
MFHVADYFVNTKDANKSNGSWVDILIDSAFAGVDTFKSKTLKLASKPDQPTVPHPCPSVTHY